MAHMPDVMVGFCLRIPKNTKETLHFTFPLLKKYFLSEKAELKKKPK